MTKILNSILFFLYKHKIIEIYNFTNNNRNRIFKWIKLNLSKKNSIFIVPMFYVQICNKIKKLTTIEKNKFHNISRCIYDATYSDRSINSYIIITKLSYKIYFLYSFPWWIDTRRVVVVSSFTNNNNVKKNQLYNTLHMKIQITFSKSK